MKKKERDLLKLTESQYDLFQKLVHCEKAAKLLIEHTMHKLEEQQMLMSEMWRQIFRKCDLKEDEMDRVRLDEDQVILLTKEYYNLTLGGDIDVKKFRSEWNKE